MVKIFEKGQSIIMKWKSWKKFQSWCDVFCNVNSGRLINLKSNKCRCPGMKVL